MTKTIVAETLYIKLILLLSYIKEIAKYNLTDLTLNCLSESQYPPQKMEY